MNAGESGSQMSCRSYVLHCHVEVVGAVGGRPRSVVQQVDLFGAPAGLVVTDVICCPVGIDQFHWLSLGNRPSLKCEK